MGVRTIYMQVIVQAEAQVISDLSGAEELYNNQLARLKDVVRIHSLRRIFTEFLSSPDDKNIRNKIRAIMSAESLDILSITDSSGRVLFFGGNSTESKDYTVSDCPLVEYVLKTGYAVSATCIVPEHIIRMENPQLLDLITMDITETPMAMAKKTERITSGMFMMSAAPVFSDDGTPAGVLYGGKALNRDYTFVDQVKSTVFGASGHKGTVTGTATIFQNDVRISTNVLNRDGSRAVSTRVSDEVAIKVLHKGETWHRRAFVVNDWYISAYSPIKDFSGDIIGMLYVGILEKPYRDSLWKSLFTFLGIALIGVIIVGIISVRIAHNISKPIRAMALASRKIAQGDYSPRIEVRTKDEIAVLAKRFNRMAMELSRVHGELKEFSNNLEKIVKERTEELNIAHRQLAQSEKLAAVGKLAAGVAHEINNPLTGVLTNSSLILEDLPENDPRREDMKIIVDETLRCRKIVKGLLDFARQTKPSKHSVNINSVIADIFALMQNQAKLHGIEFKSDLETGLPEIMADMDQIRQVVLNVMLNAVQAMSGGGNISVATRTSGANIEIRVTDSGSGIPDEIKSRLFEPFFSTKSTGTGLGLSIVYGIIKQHGGKIRVEKSGPDGTTVLIALPIQEIELENT